LNEWQRNFSGRRAAHVHVVRDFHDHSLYLDALAERLNQGLARFARPNGHAAPAPHDVHLLFSAHSLPVAVVAGGDPYQEQVEATVKAVMQRGRWANPHSLCYQSRSGPGHWLQPLLPESLQAIARSGAERVLVVPVAFVSDHVETLYEINIEARQIAETLGLRQFETMPGLNDSPAFIAALADLVLRRVSLPVSA
jgi:ferrochelatase